MNKQGKSETKAFGLLSAVFLGIGSMVGAGIFIVIGEAGAIAGSLVTVSFLVGGIIALLCGYSLSKLAVYYPSRGGIIEYLVQGYGEGVLSGSLGILFYFAQLVALAAVAKSFGTYAATYMSEGVTPLYSNLFSIGILLFFVCINLIGAALVARAENIIVVIKLAVLIAFAVAALFFIHPSNLVIDKAPELVNIFYALGLTFFAYQGFSVITNSVEDMQDPKETMLRAMFWAIGLVAVLYIAVTIAVFGNLPLDTIVKDKDYALAEAAKPAFGAWGFRIMAAAALLATASAINATLYAVTQISYTLAKDGDLPEVYDYNIFHNTEGLIISALLITPLILFFNLGQVATIAAIAVLLIQGFTHTGHLFKYKQTGANRWWIMAAVTGTFGAAWFAIAYTSKSMPHIIYYIAGIFFLAFIFEVLLRLLNNRTVGRQIVSTLKTLEENSLKRLER
ncbi:amino acid transporter [Thiogranum longum]|uniref:Amino acid transporter n=1 Tax=Thiogranum longum TaxID=1537524 RepID=A0A4R1HA23_9GAMM|nr:APC family permease [Thiogranum longum]TCK17391.1 amino acid transporter [Thiogranum longum]